ncbi:Programmed cell death 1 ligand 1 [Dissostichus eleginoides]|uniref:Programmed cell death 1 ligand 1 n=1 Tax=Dissostichus eleginoides TaxID=100907 RepID=A0AAD9BYR4_DISEL|nr:Programmed cell death 1 ligand 1 [Dissostichus eleginoides]
MIFIILLLLFLTPCVSGTFVVNVTQTSYQAEENQNITLEWTFSTRRETSLRSISTICQMFTEGRSYFLFHLHQGVESPESQDPQFAGRVQWDKDVLTEGRLTLHVSRLRTNDSGFYVCDILVRSEGSNSRRCWLNVTAAEFKPEGTTESQQPKSGRNYWISIAAAAAAAAAVMGIIATKVCFTKFTHKKRDDHSGIQPARSSEKKPTRTNTTPLSFAPLGLVLKCCFSQSKDRTNYINEVKQPLHSTEKQPVTSNVMQLQ